MNFCLKDKSSKNQSEALNFTHRKVQLSQYKNWTMSVAPPTFKCKPIFRDLLERFQPNLVSNTILSLHAYITVQKWAKADYNHITQRERESFPSKPRAPMMKMCVRY